MKTLLPLAWASAWNRRLSLTLAALSIALAVALLLSVTRAREAAQTHFAQSVAGVDLVVGPRGSPVQLLLHAVFHLGDASHTLAWKSYQALAADPLIAWRLPLALGDSHRGFPVLGSTPEYFRHLGVGQQQGLPFADGQPFAGLFEAVIGAEVAARLGYRTGQQITLQHGASHLDAHHHDEDATHPEHADKPFRIVGVLAPTGTPADRTLVVSLQALEAIHLDWQGGMPMPGLSIPAEAAGKFDLTPKHLNAVLIGLHQRTDVFRMQRQINAFGGEPLMAILPGLAMDELWHLVGSVERTGARDGSICRARVSTRSRCSSSLSKTHHSSDERGSAVNSLAASGSVPCTVMLAVRPAVGSTRAPLSTRHWVTPSTESTRSPWGRGRRTTPSSVPERSVSWYSNETSRVTRTLRTS